MVKQIVFKQEITSSPLTQLKISAVICTIKKKRRGGTFNASLNPLEKQD
jgi:hypothetical protein